MTQETEALKRADDAAWAAWPSCADYPERDAYRAGFIAASLATPSPAPSDTLASAAPLHWRKPTDHPQDGFGEPGILLVADGIGGRYSINDSGSGILLWWAHDEFVWEACLSVEDAKAKAEADWQRRYAERGAKSSPCGVANGGFLGPVLSERVKRTLNTGGSHD